MNLNKKLLKVAKYLGSQGLYEEAAQIKKMAQESNELSEAEAENLARMFGRNIVSKNSGGIKMSDVIESIVVDRLKQIDSIPLDPREFDDFILSGGNPELAGQHGMGDGGDLAAYYMRIGSIFEEWGPMIKNIFNEQRIEGKPFPINFDEKIFSYFADKEIEKICKDLLKRSLPNWMGSNLESTGTLTSLNGDSVDYKIEKSRTGFGRQIAYLVKSKGKEQED